MSGYVNLMLCVNHHQNGVFAGLCRGISLSDEECLSLESPFLNRHLKCEIGDKHFRLGKSHTWRHRGHQTWVGNWCWDAVAVTPSCAADVLNFAISKGYQVSVVSEPLFVKVEAKEKLTGLDLMQHAER